MIVNFTKQRASTAKDFGVSHLILLGKESSFISETNVNLNPETKLVLKSIFFFTPGLFHKDEHRSHRT